MAAFCRGAVTFSGYLLRKGSALWGGGWLASLLHRSNNHKHLRYFTEWVAGVVLLWRPWRAAFLGLLQEGSGPIWQFSCSIILGSRSQNQAWGRLRIKRVQKSDDNG